MIKLTDIALNVKCKISNSKCKFVVRET